MGSAVTCLVCCEAPATVSVAGCDLCAACYDEHLDTKKIAHGQFRLDTIRKQPIRIDTRFEAGLSGKPSEFFHVFNLVTSERYLLKHYHIGRLLNEMEVLAWVVKS